MYWATTTLTASLAAATLSSRSRWRCDFKGDDPVFNFLAGRDYRLLIDCDQLLEGGVLEPHVIDDATIIQHVPLERRPDTAGEGGVAEQIGKNWAE